MLHERNAPCSPGWTGRPLRRTSTPRRRCRCAELLRSTLFSVILARAVALAAKGQNRRAGGRWHRPAPVGCARARPAHLCPHPPSQWTRVRGRLSGLALTGCPSALTDHHVLMHARRRPCRLKYDRQRGRGRREGRRRLLRRSFGSRGDDCALAVKSAVLAGGSVRARRLCRWV